VLLLCRRDPGCGVPGCVLILPERRSLGISRWLPAAYLLPDEFVSEAVSLAAWRGTRQASALSRTVQMHDSDVSACARARPRDVLNPW
jgi:hypothetical protein